jgi:hypothetical protein
MSQTTVQKVEESRSTTRRVNFSDGNRELHLRVFFEWLPPDLQDTPFIDWTKLPSKVIGYLVNTVKDSPWAAHLALVAVAIQGGMGEYTLRSNIMRLNGLLRNVHTLCGIQNPAELTKETWETFFGRKEMTPGDYGGFKAFRTIAERHLPDYLGQLTPGQYARIEPYILPRFPRKLLAQRVSRASIEEGERQRRKEKSDVLSPLHALLVALVRFRKQAAERMLQAFREARELAREQARTGDVQFPLPFSYEDELVTINRDACTVAEARLEKRPVMMKFLLWDRRSWVIKHRDDYDPTTRKDAENQRAEFAPAVESFFVQFLGPVEDLLWFGDVIKYRLLQDNTPRRLSQEDVQHRKDLLGMLGVSTGLTISRGCLLTPGLDFSQAFSNAMTRTGALLFEPESLYRGCLYGAALAMIALTGGYRISELLQVSADRFKTRPYVVKREGFPDGEGRVMHLQLLLPKGKRTEEQRKLFLVSDGAYQLLREIAQGLKNAHGGRIPVVHPHTHNTKAEDLSPERYLFQWDADTDGRSGALGPPDVGNLLRFILYGVEFRTREGEPFSVTVHLLRHVMATVARHEHEVPVEALARVLHQETGQGMLPEATYYYSEETEERSLITFAEFQSDLEEWAASLLVEFPEEQDLEGMDEDLRESFERWHTLLETTFGFCSNINLCPRGYNRTLCIGCAFLVPDPRKRQQALNWRTVYVKLAEELEAQGNTVDARQYRLLVRDLDDHINAMAILQASIEDGKRKPVFLLLPSAPYEEVIIDAEA